QSSLRWFGKPSSVKRLSAALRVRCTSGGPRAAASFSSCAKLALWMFFSSFTSIMLPSSLGLDRLFFGLSFDPAVALLLQLECQLLAARLDDAAVVEHVHLVGHDVVEQPLVVRDDQDGPILAPQRVDAVGHGKQGI